MIKTNQNDKTFEEKWSAWQEITRKLITGDTKQTPYIIYHNIENIITRSRSNGVELGSSDKNHILFQIFDRECNCNPDLYVNCLVTEALDAVVA